MDFESDGVHRFPAVLNCLVRQRHVNMGPDPPRPEEPDHERLPLEANSPSEPSTPPGGADEAKPAPDAAAEQPERPARRSKAQPHLGWAVVWNLGFVIVLFGTLIAIVAGTTIVLVVIGDKRLKAAPAEGQPPIPPPLADALAIGFPIGYLAGLAFALLAPAAGGGTRLAPADRSSPAGKTSCGAGHHWSAGIRHHERPARSGANQVIWVGWW